MSYGLMRYALGGVLVLSGALTEGVLVATAGDANGDFEVDVLDLQFVVAQVFNGGAEDRRADVNADGRVDVLDVQCILDWARGTHPIKPNRQGKPAQLAVAAQRAGMPGMTSGVKRVDPAEDDQCEWTEMRRVCFVPPEVLTLRTQRYVCCLMPNAPPERA